MNTLERTLRTKNLLWYNCLFWLLACLLELVKVYSIQPVFTINFDYPLLIQWPISAYLSYWVLSYGVVQIYLATYQLKRPQFLIVHVLFALIFGLSHKILSPVIAILLERLIISDYSFSFGVLFAQCFRTWYDVVLSIPYYIFLLVVLSAISYYRKYQDSTIRKSVLESELSAAHLATMKMQLHPHFLFNAFNTIAMMVRTSKQQEAIKMITSLSEMLRKSLEKETLQFVNMEEEISLLKNYLDIESQRYKDRLTITWDLDPQLNSIEIPSFVLQPIVENAFKHGISRNLDQAVLAISSRLKGKYIALEVFNSGSQLPSNWEFQKDKGIGLANTSTRLMELYEKDIKFIITQKKDGVSVILELPIRKNK
jgi:sensor histidine kinase YesM